LTTGTEQVTHRHLNSRAGEHSVDLALQVGAQPYQLGPVAHPATQLTGGRRSNPRLGQPTHPQQIGQVRGVALVVLDPPVGEHLHPQRVRQMHPGTQLGQTVRGPVPAVSSLEHHLRRLTGTGHHLTQVLRIIRDPRRLQPLPGLGHPHQHRPPPMQINADELPSLVDFAHRGLLESLDVSTPSMNRESRGAEAPLLHRIKARAKPDRAAAARALTPTPPGRRSVCGAEKHRFS
jgi:hypothetical protein